MSIVLASASPRRRELLETLGVKFEIVPALEPERPPKGADAEQTVRALSRSKALEVARKRPDAVVIGADTVVACEEEILGKPRSEEDARRMLRMLSGRVHSVFTGVTIARGGEVLTEAEQTRVFFRPIADAEITRYITTGEPMDKAGAYACQGLASLFVERIEGDFFNVMGLPLYRLGRMLEKMGVALL
jgi:septum formation protein